MYKRHIHRSQIFHRSSKVEAFEHFAVGAESSTGESEGAASDQHELIMGELEECIMVDVNV